MNISEALEEDDKEQLRLYTQTIFRLFRDTEVNYWIGNPSVQITSGSIIFDPITLPKDGGSLPLEQLVEELKTANEISPDCLCLMLLGVPNSKCPMQVCECIADFLCYIEQSRVVRSSENGYYGFLMKFVSAKAAAEFYNNYFGEKMNAFEEYRLLVRGIKNITVTFDEFNLEAHKQFSIIRKKSVSDPGIKVGPENIFMSYNLDQLTDQPKPEFICTICFQQMAAHPESESRQKQPSPNQKSSGQSHHQGILSILCGHYFHWDCLERWKEQTCPLCRYHLKPPLLSFCQACNISEGLWMCLVCGKKLCTGPVFDLTSKESHIFEHFLDIGHSLVMEIETKFVYDFALKDFVHRVYYNQQTGRPSAGSGGKDKDKDGKGKDIARQYEQMLRVQMEEQRYYYQKQMVEERLKQKSKLEEQQKNLKDVKAEIQEIEKSQAEYKEIEQKIKEEIEGLENEVRAAEKYQKLLIEREKAVDEQVQKHMEKEKEEEKLLQELILQKREEIRDIQRNIQMNQQFKKKIKGQKIAKEFFINKK